MPINLGEITSEVTPPPAEKPAGAGAPGGGAGQEGGAAASPGKTETGQRIEVHAAFRFVVNIGDAEVCFTECTLPNLEVDVVEQREGGYNTGVHLLPGPVKAGRITLRSGVTKSSELLKWYKQVAAGKVKAATRNITVTMVDAELKPVMRMDFLRAYPVKWTGPAFKTGESAMAIEALELAFAEVQVE